MNVLTFTIKLKTSWVAMSWQIPVVLDHAQNPAELTMGPAQAG